MMRAADRGVGLLSSRERCLSVNSERGPQLDTLACRRLNWTAQRLQLQTGERHRQSCSCQTSTGTGRSRAAGVAATQLPPPLPLCAAAAAATAPAKRFARRRFSRCMMTGSRGAQTHCATATQPASPCQSNPQMRTRRPTSVCEHCSRVAAATAIAMAMASCTTHSR